MAQGEYASHHMRISLNRAMVDDRLSEQGTDFATFVADHQSQGLSLDEIWRALSDATGVPFSTRTLYRWVRDLEKVSA